MNPIFLCKKLFLGFHIFGVQDTALINGANSGTLGILMETDTLGAELGIDDIYGIPFTDCIVWTLRNACTTRNTVVFDL
jgi:hypothetical protein